MSLEASTSWSPEPTNMFCCLPQQKGPCRLMRAQIRRGGWCWLIQGGPASQASLEEGDRSDTPKGRGDTVTNQGTPGASELGEAKRTLPWSFQRKPPFPHLDFNPVRPMLGTGLPELGGHFGCSKPLRLWEFVTAGNKNLMRCPLGP